MIRLHLSFIGTLITFAPACLSCRSEPPEWVPTVTEVSEIRGTPSASRGPAVLCQRVARSTFAGWVEVESIEEHQGRVVGETEPDPYPHAQIHVRVLDQWLGEPHESLSLYARGGPLLVDDEVAHMVYQISAAVGERLVLMTNEDPDFGWIADGARMFRHGPDGYVAEEGAVSGDVIPVSTLADVQAEVEFAAGEGACQPYGPANQVYQAEGEEE